MHVVEVSSNLCFCSAFIAIFVYPLPVTENPGSLLSLCTSSPLSFDTTFITTAPPPPRALRTTVLPFLPPRRRRGYMFLATNQR